MAGPGQLVGYIRVSTVDQHTERQLDGIELDRTFIDKASGATLERPQLIEALKYVRDGDTLIVHSMDRLARNLEDLRRIVRQLTGKGVRVEFRKEGQTFTGDDSPMSTLLLSMLGAVAEFERSLIRERQREGIAIAKAKGVYKGRRPSLTRTQEVEVRERYGAGESASELAREFGCSRYTIYRAAKESAA